MLFSDAGGTRPPVVLAVSQPAHALISGQVLAAWAEPLDERVVLAAGQHDVAWLDWEVAPSFDPATARPHSFRDIGAAEHAPMWERGVDRALAAWGRRVALLVSRHGSTIYRRFADRHRSTGDALAADERAAADYLRRHAALQDGWARALGLSAETVEQDAELIAFADTASLVLCGALPMPAEFAIGARTIAWSSPAADTYRLDPWPFAPDSLTVEAEARPVPEGGLADAAAMRAWLAEPARATRRATLLRG